MHSVSIIGVGRMGGALALALSRRGYPVENLIHRSRDTAEAVSVHLTPATRLAVFDDAGEVSSDIVLITAGDAEIGNIVNSIVTAIRRGSIILHTSGSLSSSVLEPLQKAGAKIGSMHPLVSISDPLIGAQRFDGAFFCIEGDDDAVAAARAIAESLGGKPFSIETKLKPLYHASAVTACGHVVALIDAAIEMLSHCGPDRDRAQEVLLPLIRSTVENLETQTPSQALTGTFARADGAAFERHLRAFEGEVPDEIRDIYLLLGERSLELAQQRGVDGEKAAELRSRISIAKRNREC